MKSRTPAVLPTIRLYDPLVYTDHPSYKRVTVDFYTRITRMANIGHINIIDPACTEQELRNSIRDVVVPIADHLRRENDYHHEHNEDTRLELYGMVNGHVPSIDLLVHWMCSGAPQNADRSDALYRALTTVKRGRILRADYRMTTSAPPLNVRGSIFRGELSYTDIIGALYHVYFRLLAVLREHLQKEGIWMIP
jgi:hypothetical protein